MGGRPHPDPELRRMLEKFAFNAVLPRGPIPRFFHFYDGTKIAEFTESARLILNDLRNRLEGCQAKSDDSRNSDC